MLDVSLPNRTEPTLHAFILVFVLEKRRLLNTHFEERIYNRFCSLPNIEDRKSELKPIPGLMPDPTKLPKGCAFAPRCPYAKPDCIDTPQVERYFSQTHSVMCSAYDDPKFRIEREEIG